MLPGNGNEFKSFPDLSIALPFECRPNRAVLDGSTGDGLWHAEPEHRSADAYHRFTLLAWTR